MNSLWDIHFCFLLGKEGKGVLSAQKKTARKDSLFHQGIKPFLQPSFPCKLLFPLLFLLQQQPWPVQP